MMKDKTVLASTNATDIEIDKLEAILAKYHRDDAPGALVSVQRHGKVLLRRGYGLANIECAQANTPSTKMRIGSTTKHFACVMALLLRDDGKLSIDEPVSRWLPELSASQGRRTLRQRNAQPFDRELAHSVLLHARMERGQKVRGLARIYEGDADMFNAVTHVLGYRLGDRLYYALVRGHIDKPELRSLFFDPFEDEGAAFATYLYLIGRLRGVEVPERL